jgi:tetratricopeptide (TPR) repeat protein
LAQAIDHQRVLAFALEMLARVALVKENYAEAQQLLQQSLEKQQQCGMRSEEGRVCGTLAYLFYQMGDIPQTQHFIVKGLQIGLALPDKPAVSNALAVVSLLLAHQGDIERALELETLCRTAPDIARSVWQEDLFSRPVTAAAAHLSPAVVESARARGRKLDLWETAAHILEQLPFAR